MDSTTIQGNFQQFFLRSFSQKEFFFLMTSVSTAAEGGGAKRNGRHWHRVHFPAVDKEGALSTQHKIHLLPQYIDTIKVLLAYLISTRKVPAPLSSDRICNSWWSWKEKWRRGKTCFKETLALMISRPAQPVTCDPAEIDCLDSLHPTTHQHNSFGIDFFF